MLKLTSYSFFSTKGINTLSESEIANICDKCGKPVAPENSALQLVTIVSQSAAPFILDMDRHLFPTKTCEGSPSRVALIAPRLWIFSPKWWMGFKHRKAYQEMRTKYSK